jgi:hypothetical protein
MGFLLLLLLTTSAAPPHAHDPPAHAQKPTARCSQDGRAVIRVRLLDPKGRTIAVPANAVIIALRCGAQPGPDGTAELAAVPAGRHVVQVRALGLPPDSLEVMTGAADTVHVTAHMRAGYRVRPDSASSSPPR